MAIGQPRVERGYSTSVSPRLVEIYSRRFGRRRARGSRPGSATPPSASVPPRSRRRCSDVNRLLNRVPFVDDAVHWREEDYWATPAESIGSNGADCEDFSIAKYFLLKELGVPIARLRLTYVKSLRLNQAHMVLAYYARPDAEPLVLDNLEDTVRPASQRRDLVPVYSFNDEEVWVELRGRAGSPQQLRNWRALMERLDWERRT